MFKIRVDKYIVSVQETELLVAGAVSTYKCHFTFDEFWDGFFRSAVFRAGAMVKTVPLDTEDTCELPWELLTVKHIGLPVEVSVYGSKNETEILPTIWDKLGRVRGGSEPGEDAKEPTPNVYGQITNLVKVYADKVTDEVEAADAFASESREHAKAAENAATAAANAETAAASALAGVREALKNIPAGSTLIVNDLTTGGASAALSAEMGKVLAQRPNPDILINSYFLDPVNQRGFTTGPSYSTNSYHIDRWKRSGYSSGVLTLSEAGFTVDSTASNASYYNRIVQRLPKVLPEGTYTLSVLVAPKADTENSGDNVRLRFQSIENDTVLLSEDFADASKKGLLSLTFSGANLDSVTIGTRGGNSATFIAAKLESGSTQTLAHQDADGNWILNEIPDYGTELLKCQRYYQLFSGEAAMPADPVDYRPNMRATPAIGTIEVDGVTYWYADAEL